MARGPFKRGAVVSSWWLLAGTLSATACTGFIGDRGDEPGEGIEVPPEARLAGESGLRRLTVDEYDNTLFDLLLDDTRPGSALLPKEGRTPFDNDFQEQMASQALIEGAEKLAGDAAVRLLADPARRDAIVGCSPTGPDDQACFASFVERFGRRALRRSLTDDEVEAYQALLALGVEANDFYMGVETALRAFLQDPSFLYRVETGIAVGDGLFKLRGVEVASRLSYLLWGSMPDDDLLDLAEGGQLDSPEGVRAAAEIMFADERARARVARFHAMWLGYENLKHDAALAAAMQAETRALLDRVVFDDNAAWHDLLRAEETFVSDSLAEHYGLEPAGSPEGAWVAYADSGRKGLLSHGTFLSNGSKFSDTSPTMRGIAIRTRLFCQTIPPPPPGVTTDEPPPESGSPCKADRYAVHAQPGCAGCHNLTDKVGFGLENYDHQGRYRTHDVDLPECTIEGKGEIEGIGTFEGPAGLADLVLQSEMLNRCVVTHLFKLSVGRSELDATDNELIDSLASELGAGDFTFEDLVLEHVGNAAFGFRAEEKD